MQAVCLFPEETIRENGYGPVLSLGDAAGKPLLLTLTLLTMGQQHTLDVSVWGSADGMNWGERPLYVLPHRYYCGTYTETLDLEAHPAIQFLRVGYGLRTWAGRPSFAVARFELTLEECHEEVLSAVG